MATFAEMKNNREARTAALLQKISATDNKNTREKDETYWSPTVDEAGNASAVIRFLPAPDPEDEPYVKIYKHAFKNPGTQKWYIENSLTTIGEKDPVGNYNGSIWNKGPEAQAQARSQGRNLKYHTNIYVIKDPGNPENEGKVFRWTFGKKIHDMITAAIKPEDEDDVAFDPYDLWGGANFRFKQVKVEVTEGGQRRSYPNYDKSKFEAPKPLFDDDDDIEAVWKLAYPLQPLVAPDQFKSYEELERRLNIVLGISDEPPRRSARPTDEDSDTFSDFTAEPETKKAKTEETEESTEDWFKEFESLKDDDVPF